MLTDLRFALRLFARNPLFTAAVALVLGLGIGATTTVFSLVDAYLLSPLPFPEPERLMSIWRTRRPELHSMSPFSEPDFDDLRAQAQSFSQLASMRSASLNLSGGGPAGHDAPPERVDSSRVNGDFFALFGVGAALGRAFTADECAPGRDQVVVLSDALFRQRFHADPGVIGRTVTLDGRPHQVVGVMPPSFRVPANLWASDPSQLWVPGVPSTGMQAKREWHSWTALGRLRPGVSLAAADAEVRAIAARLEQAYPDSNTNQTFYLRPLQDTLTRNVKSSLTLLFYATLMLLVVASANVALLLLARAATREGEVAVRAALGASRPRLVRQLLAESLLLSLGGGALGFALSFAGTGLVAAGYEGTAMPARDVQPDVRVLLFALLLASLTGLGFGLLPALRASKARLAGLLKEGATRATAGADRRRTQAALLVAEIALSTVLLAGSAAVARGFYTTLNQPLGFSTESALTFSLQLPAARYRDAASTAAFHAAFLEKLRALPSALAAGATTILPLGNAMSDNWFEIEGKPPWPPGDEQLTVTQWIDPDYFRAIGLPLLRGRPLLDSDRAASAPVIVVSDSFARTYLPGEDPVGKRMRWNGDEQWREIVGVVGDVRYFRTSADYHRFASYVPFAQTSQPSALSYASFVLRTGGDPRALANAARQALRELDADLSVGDVKTYEELSRESMTGRRFTLVLVSAFAGSALLLTALGLFGLVSYQTKRRSRELAIRMALGAASTDVQRLVLRDTSRLLLAGLGLGLPAAFAASRLLAAQLEGVPPADPLTLAATALLLGLVALAAVLAPARHAARTPPALVLRND
jgi:putative ABC transport system permease protein